MDHKKEIVATTWNRELRELQSEKRLAEIEAEIGSYAENASKVFKLDSTFHQMKEKG